MQIEGVRSIRTRAMPSESQTSLPFSGLHVSAGWSQFGKRAAESHRGVGTALLWLRPAGINPGLSDCGVVAKVNRGQRARGRRNFGIARVQVRHPQERVLHYTAVFYLLNTRGGGRINHQGCTIGKQNIRPLPRLQQKYVQRYKALLDTLPTFPAHLLPTGFSCEWRTWTALNFYVVPVYWHNVTHAEVIAQSFNISGPLRLLAFEELPDPTVLFAAGAGYLLSLGWKLPHAHAIRLQFYLRRGLLAAGYRRSRYGGHWNRRRSSCGLLGAYADITQATNY
ncbi:hypothetical protein B0H17DRAFT_1149754 [Mycena rosella]|uniref:Uncharacterized protein n=1 Tax=Mycena rosella TaxID=1033263 RepID=A0AAD7FRF2_MYCRO|nr:hypothetical protein B0H17DRAFT_1149754 [Mycena rosella]